MKLTFIILMSIISLKSFAVEIHPQGFSNIPAGSGVHYSGRMMQWSVWETTPEHDLYGLPFNYVAVATEDLGDPSLVGNDFDIPGQDAGAMQILARYYSARDIEYPEVQVQAEAVFTSKIQVDLAAGVDASSLNLSSFIDSFIKSDSPHVYSQVSAEWVGGFLPNFHLAKEQLNDSSIYYLVTINSGESVYNCPVLNSALKRNDDALVNLNGEAFLYLIVKFDEVDTHPVVEDGASKIFTQEIIYGTSFIQAGKNVISFYDSGKLISQNAIVTTDKVMKVPEVFVNRLDLNGLEQAGVALSALGGSDNEFVLSSDNVNIVNADNNQCGQGLGLGVASYTYNIANIMMSGL